MPLSKYFKGHGEEVMEGMQKKYGKRAKEVFYATSNKKGMNPERKMPAPDIRKHPVSHRFKPSSSKPEICEICGMRMNSHMEM